MTIVDTLEELKGLAERSAKLAKQDRGGNLAALIATMPANCHFMIEPSGDARWTANIWDSARHRNFGARERSAYAALAHALDLLKGWKAP